MLVDADIRLGSLFQDNMVLQQETQVSVWGWAEAGETISVEGSWPGGSASTRVVESGKWVVQISTPSAGGPYSLTVEGSTTIILENVFVGEVWICGGQSNMAMPFYREAEVDGQMLVYKVDDHEVERFAADHPEIRVFRTEDLSESSDHAMDAVGGKWQAASPEMAQNMPAVPYFFGRELHKALNVPMGLVVTAMNATQIEAWLSPASLDTDSELSDYLGVVADSLEQPAFSLYNTHMHPLIPYGIRGVIWYQGESNRGDHMIYHEKMRALINGWRAAWGRGEFPFYFVQLAPCSEFYDDFELPKLWEAQAEALKISNTGMALSSDLSDLNLHPGNKQDVGRRLARLALAEQYGFDGIVAKGPRFESMGIKNNTITLTFDTLGTQLISRHDKPIDSFTVAGEDRIFKSAMAKINGNKVIISSKDVLKPVAVRFAWKNDARPNLMNTEGLPAYPFRTDNWPLAGQTKNFSEFDSN